MPVEPSPFARWITDLGPAFIGLMGVLVGGVIQTVTTMVMAGFSRKDRLADEAAARGREEEKREAERKFVRAILARHLEAYARECAEVMWANDDPDEEGAMNPPEFKNWPNDIAWDLLGSNEMMMVRDIETRVDIQRRQVEGLVHMDASDERQARSYFMDGAARLGLDAWKAAKELRRKAGVEPFKFPRDGGGFAQSLADHVGNLDDRARLYEERKIAAQSGTATATDRP